MTVYGDNFLSRSTLTCLVVPAICADSCVDAIASADAELLAAKDSLAVLKAEYLEVPSLQSLRPSFRYRFTNCVMCDIVRRLSHCDVMMFF